MPRKRAADFDQSFLDMVEAPPSVYTAEQEAAKKIDRRHKRRVKDYYPIYSDNPGGWQADLMFLPYTNSRNETRLHAILCVININSKYAFARMLPFTHCNSRPVPPLDKLGGGFVPRASRDNLRMSMPVRLSYIYIITHVRRFSGNI